MVPNASATKSRYAASRGIPELGAPAGSNHRTCDKTVGNSPAFPPCPSFPAPHAANSPYIHRIISGQCPSSTNYTTGPTSLEAPKPCSRLWVPCGVKIKPALRSCIHCPMSPVFSKVHPMKNGTCPAAWAGFPVFRVWILN